MAITSAVVVVKQRKARTIEIMVMIRERNRRCDANNVAMELKGEARD